MLHLHVYREVKAVEAGRSYGFHTIINGIPLARPTLPRLRV